MPKGDPCFFNEPRIGRCNKPAVGCPSKANLTDDDIYAGLCCEEHSGLKCDICGGQAFTRCMASIGVMCGTPLCTVCGKGEMCRSHAGSGPGAVVNKLQKEVQRLKRGEFTPEEFQALCHHRDERPDCTCEDFMTGCHKYWHKLFNGRVFPYTLLVKDGIYEDNNLFWLVLAVLSHRFPHWWRGEGWRD